MNEKREKGLCYNCDEHITPGHQCKKCQLFLLNREEECKVSTIDEIEEGKLEEEELQISVHVTTGATSYPTIRAKGYTK